MVLKGNKIPKYSMEQYNQVLTLNKKNGGSFRLSKLLNIPRPTLENWINKGVKPYYFSEKRINACNSSKNIERIRCLNKITQPKAVKIAAELRTKKLPFNAKNLTRDLAYILGVVYGDGHISIEQRKVILSAIDYDFVLSFKHVIENWSGFRARFFKRIQKPDLQIKNRKLQWRCYIDSIEASKFLKNFNLNLLLDASDNIKCAFIRGFFDSEGCVYDNRISFCNTNLKLIRLVNKLLNAVGIKTILKKRKYLNNLTNRLLVCYYLYITSECRDIFCKLVGSSISRKQEKLKELMITKL